MTCGRRTALTRRILACTFVCTPGFCCLTSMAAQGHQTKQGSLRSMARAHDDPIQHGFRSPFLIDVHREQRLALQRHSTIEYRNQTERALGYTGGNCSPNTRVPPYHQLYPLLAIVITNLVILPLRRVSVSYKTTMNSTRAHIIPASTFLQNLIDQTF